MQISEHISYEEATHSQTAVRLKIENIPNEDQVRAMKVIAEKCFEPLRAWWNKPLQIDSFYRCPELNKAVGGSASSQHVKGEAIDINAGSHADNQKLYDWCKANLIFDQLIHEYGSLDGPAWVHISFSAITKNRNQTLNIK